MIHGLEEGTELGEGQGSLQNLGDVNGDGRDDLGMKDTDGRFFILWGKQYWGVNYDLDQNGTNDIHLIDLSVASTLDGNSISGSLIDYSFNFKGVGDVDGDGYDDFLISTPYKSWVSEYSGQEYGQIQLVYGQSNWLGEFTYDNLNTILIKGDHLGHYIIPLGDFDGDGRDEFAFSSGSLYGHQIIYPWSVNDTIYDKSQPDPSITLDNSTVLENQHGAIIGSLSALNLQSGETINYSNITIGGDYAYLFEITASGELKLKDDIALDYEGDSDDVVIYLSGTTSEGVGFKRYFTIKIVDVNETPEFTLSGQWVADGAAAGAIVGSVNIIEITADQNDTYIYTLGGDDAQYFELSASGELKLKDNVTPDFSNKSDYLLTVNVTDAAGLTSSQSISIAVNVAPTDLSLSANTVDESHYGLEVGSVNVTDLNTNDTIVYALSGPDLDYFEITAEGILKLKDDVYADYEIKDSYSVTITATDQGGFSVEKTYSITVNDLPYATPYCSDIQSQGNVELFYSYVDSLLIGISLDPDADASTPLTLTYSIITPDSVFAPGYRAAEYTSDIATPTDAFIAAVDQVFSMITQFTGVTFVKITETATQVGDIRIGCTNVEVDFAGESWVDYDGYYNQNYQDSGDSDIWISPAGSGVTTDDWSAGTYGFMVIIHEIGHSLGLDHPHELTPNISGYTTPVGNIITDNLWYSIMSYRDFLGDNWGDDPDESYVVDANGNDMMPFTFMFYDIWALRYLYSVNDQTGGFIVPDVVDDEAYGLGGTGDNTYTITDTTQGMFTIFDTGGTDTIDFSTMSLDSTINLNGTLSWIGTDVINYDDGEAQSGLIIGLYWWAIENVNAGSGDDTITCNDDANLINCGPGSDTVNAIGIGDSVYGDAGDDIFVVGDTSFTLIDGGDGFDKLDFRSLIADGSDLDLTTLTDSQITNIEAIDVYGNNISTVVKLTEQSLLDFNATVQAMDFDEDGDDDYFFYIVGGSSLDLISLASSENWVYFNTVDEGTPTDWYQSEDGDTYFGVNSGMGVYEIASTSSLSINNQTISENLANAVVGTLVISDFNQLSPSGSVNYTLSGADADKFEIDSDGILRLKYGTVANYESHSTYNISISCLGVSANLVISVSDAEENTINGTAWGETIYGTSVDDHIYSAGGDDDIDGGGGNDTLLLFASRSSFSIITLAGITKITGKSTAGTYAYDKIRMTTVETIQFTDQALAVDAVLNDATYYYGTVWGENIYLGNDDNVIDSAGGDDDIDGGGGNDTLLLFASRSSFQITTLGDITKITGKSTAGTYAYDEITMTNVETIQFTDQTVQVSDLTSMPLPSTSDTDENTPIDPDEDDTPVAPSDDDDTPIIPPDDDTPPDIQLPDLSLFVNDFDLGSITLPDTVMTSEDAEVPDLSDLIGLIGDQGESLAFDFDAVDTESPVVASVESVKPVLVDWIAHTEPFIDSDWKPIIEELFWTSEMG
jgi:hypothetical protein